MQNLRIKEDLEKAKKGCRSRKLSLDNIDERKIAMHGIETRLEEFKRYVEDETRLDTISFSSEIISNSLPILSYIVKIPSMSQDQATKDDMKYELSKLFGKMRENLVIAIKKPGRDNTSSSCSESSGSDIVEKLKDRIKTDMERMEISDIRNMVANDVKTEVEKCLMLLYSIANVFLPTIEWIVMYAQNYDGSGNTLELEGHLRNKEELLKAGFENLIMNTGVSIVWPKSS